MPTSAPESGNGQFGGIQTTDTSLHSYLSVLPIHFILTWNLELEDRNG